MSDRAVFVGGGCIFYIIVLICIVVFLKATVVLWPIIVPQFTGIIPVKQITMFIDKKNNGYPVLVEVPKEIRPGMDCKLIIRGAKYNNWTTPCQITFYATTSTINLVRSIEPNSIKESIAPGISWLLSPRHLLISTVNLEKPDGNIVIDIEQQLTINNNIVYSGKESILISLDLTPIPMSEVVKGIISFVITVVLIVCKLKD